MMEYLNFFIHWFKNDLALFGTIIITIVATIVFIYEVIQKVRSDKKLEALLFFIGYLITILGLILIILQSINNIQISEDTKNRLNTIEKHLNIK